jgi:hypothetical protein
MKSADKDDAIAIAGAATGCGCIGAIVMVKLAVVAAVIFGLVELGLFLSRR